MQLLSTEIDESRVELTFASELLIDAAEQLVSIRMPRRTDERSSVALHQLCAIRDAMEELEKHRFRLDRIVNQIG